MGKASYSAHISNGKSAITSKGKLRGVANHNLRKYKSEEYSSENVLLLKGTKDLYQDVKNVYEKEFAEVIKEYNKKQTRADRKIEDYFEHVAKIDQDMAVEIIFQCGDKKFWEEHTDKEERMYYVYNYTLDKLEEYLPDFKVANAVIHFDEASPHMHVVGVPVWEGAKRGLPKKVSKRNVFTPETLSEILQEKIRVEAAGCFKFNVKEVITDKKKGRNYDLTVAEYKVAKEEERCQELQKKVGEVEVEIDELVVKKKFYDNEINKATLMKQATLLDQTLEESKLKQIKKDITFYEVEAEEKLDEINDLDKRKEEIIQKTNMAEELYSIMMASDSPEYDLKEKLIEVSYEYEKLKAENTRLKEKLDKAYDYMKQFVVNGRNLLEQFKEATGQVIHDIRDGFRR